MERDNRRETRLKSIDRIKRVFQLAEAEREVMGQDHPVHFDYVVRDGDDWKRFDFNESSEVLLKRAKKELVFDAIHEGYGEEALELEREE